MFQATVGHIVQITEYERGWGQRPEGYYVFEAKEAVDAFMKKIADERRGVKSVPDEYETYDYMGVKVLGEKTVAHFKAQKAKTPTANMVWVKNFSA